ncbi:MAG: PQQ-binding-like beta-propeller repeat protein [Mariprofundaceae bacterium]|nr:PQQ-binding-like beta-propeller repeat protein [Mariprofundaceae bacterium]
MLQACMFNQGLHSNWQKNVDQRQSASAYGYSIPAVHQDNIMIAGQDARLHIYSPNGWERQRIALDAPCEGGILALKNGQAILSDSQGTLYAVDTKQESVLWRYKLSSASLGHPVAFGHDIIVQTADNHIYRLNAKGKKQWSYAGSVGGLGMYFGSSPVVQGQTIYAILNNGDAVALNASNGDLIWQKQLNIDPFAQVLSELRAPVADPIIAGNMLIVSFYQGELRALNLQTGDIIWKRHFSLKSNPLLHQGMLYFSTSTGDSLAINPKDGVTQWKQHLSSAEVVGPALYDQKLWFADHNGQIYALSTEGKVQQTMRIPARIDRAPVSSAHGILIRNHRGVLHLVSQ